jgi:hypothetical protein
MLGKELLIWIWNAVESLEKGFWGREGTALLRALDLEH